MSAIADNLARLNERIAAAAVRSGRRIEDITLVAVTKKQPAAAVAEALAAGAADLGENYVQEAVEKQSLLGPSKIKVARWHLLGHLQGNKSKAAVGLFDLIQSIDSVKLAQSLGKHSQAIGKVQNILLQVHLGEEETKTGLRLEQVPDALDEIAAVPGIRLDGVMGIAPFRVDPRPHFQNLRQIFERLPLANQQTLSMGMSGDFETAIEEGATMVRVGTTIFGTRTVN